VTTALPRVLLAATFLLLAGVGACHNDSSGTGDAGTGDGLSASPGSDGGDVDLSTDDTLVVEPDAGGTVPTMDGGVKQIGCGGMPCDTTTNICCLTIGSATCEPSASCTMGIARACDGPEDCPAGMATCCVKALGASSCVATCNAGVPACHSKSDCPAPMMANRVAACCPVSATLRTCLNLPMGSVPAACN
jgi:hypothetical protein